MMGKMGMGLAALLGKELLGRGAAGGVLGAVGGLGRRMVGGGGGQGGGKGASGRGQGGRGRAQRTEPLEDALRQLLDAGRSAVSGRGDGERPAAAAAGETRVGALPSGTTLTAQRQAALDALLAQVASFTDGRVRVRHPVLRETAVHEPLREELTRAGCFTGVTFNAKTGSLLLEYDPRRHSRADFLEAALPVGLLLARCA